MTHIQRKVHIVNDLRVNFLLSTDVIISKNIIVNYFKKQLSITNCEDFVIVISINFINSRVNRIIYIKISITLILNAIIEVLIQVRKKDNLSTKRD